MSKITNREQVVSLADNIRHRRNRLGLSQKMLADRMGVPQPRVSDLECERNDNPQLQTILAVANALGTNLSKLLKISYKEEQ